MKNVTELPLNRYNTFLPRLMSAFIDSLIIMGIGELIKLFPATDSKSSFLIFQGANNLAVLFYFVISHGHFGYTLGKKFMDLKVTRLDEVSLIGYKRAFFRESVWFILNIILIGYVIIKSANSDSIDSETKQLFGLIGFNIAIAWMIIELATMLMNDKRRAIHDFIAGSVVINTK